MTLGIISSTDHASGMRVACPSKRADVSRGTHWDILLRGQNGEQEGQQGYHAERRYPRRRINVHEGSRTTVRATNTIKSAAYQNG